MVFRYHADMISMSDYATWKIPVSAVIFLLVCAWHNRRAGYRKYLGVEPALDASPIWHPSITRQEENFHEYTRQLVSLKLALDATTRAPHEGIPVARR